MNSSDELLLPPDLALWGVCNTGPLGGSLAGGIHAHVWKRPVLIEVRHVLYSVLT